MEYFDIEESKSVVDSIVDSLQDMVDSTVDFLPNLIGAIVLLFVGMFVASVVSTVVRQALKMLEKQQFVKDFLKKVGLNNGLNNALAKFSYWLVFIVFLKPATETLGLDALTDTVDDLIAFAPKIFSFAVIASVTYFGAKILRELVEAAIGSVDKSIVRPIGGTVQAVIMIFGIVTALSQLGVNLSLVNNSLTVIVAGLALAFAISFGLGGRQLAASYLAGTLKATPLKVGQKVVAGDIKGKVKSVGAVSAVIETKEGDTVVSLAKLLS